jgi:hypothetical protein
MSDEPDVPWWPEDHERLTLYVLQGNRSDVARVAGVGPVVAHHEDLALWHHRRPEGTRIGGLFVNVGLLLAFAVDEERPVLHRDFVSWKPYDALYQILLAPLGATLEALEDYDVVPLGRVEAVDELVDENSISYLKGRDHALRRDPEGLQDERAYEAEDQGEGDEQDDQELDQPVLGLWGRMLSLSVIPRRRDSTPSPAWLAHTPSYTTAQKYPRGASEKTTSRNGLEVREGPRCEGS